MVAWSDGEAWSDREWEDPRTGTPDLGEVRRIRLVPMVATSGLRWARLETEREREIRERGRAEGEREGMGAVM